MGAHTSVTTESRLEELVAQVSSLPASDQTLLWPYLLNQLHTDEASVVTALNELYGIQVFLELEFTQLIAAGKVEALPFGFSISKPGKSYLLFNNPWAAESVQAFAHRNDGHTQLAIARPEQLVAMGEKANYSTAVPQQDLSKPSEKSATSDLGSASPVVAFVDDAIARAYTDGASDIHFETDRLGIGIKFRLDGVMAIGTRLDQPQRAEEVISRIKVLAQLDITERRRPQDGRIHWTHPQGDTIDLRVSIMPSIFGEDAVLRLLDKAQLRHANQAMSLNVLGFDERWRELLRDLASRPHGMLLITGPTGSGKTTTVYAALSEVNNGLEKIITIEDPVEYELPGVLQIPVNEQKGLTFATGLRSILRHDPDKILVGEIRDAETAEIAVQSALTGHLVFTTVHANSLFDVLGRFQHFHIDPFALMSALNGIVVQRLLRKLCVHCLKWRPPTGQENEKIQQLLSKDLTRIPVACGCQHCRNTGYKGRFVVAEVHALNDNLRDMIVNKSSMTDLKKQVYAYPEDRLLAQAMTKVAHGHTTIEEVSRVVGFV
jgi:general secretion pathway protein E